MSELFVIFKVASAEYLLPARLVLQMESYTGATLVPGAPRYVLGVVQVRGRVIPVVDLRARFGLPEGTLGIDSRLVVGSAGERAVGLLVDSAREVMKLAPDALRPPPRLVTDRAGGFVTAIAQVGARILMLLDLQKLIGEDDLHVES